jgi:hypothetical protein
MNAIHRDSKVVFETLKKVFDNHRVPIRLFDPDSDPDPDPDFDFDYDFDSDADLSQPWYRCRDCYWERLLVAEYSSVRIAVASGFPLTPRYKHPKGNYLVIRCSLELDRELRANRRQARCCDRGRNSQSATVLNEGWEGAKSRTIRESENLPGERRLGFADGSGRTRF